VSAVGGQGAPRARVPRPERLLPLACVASAACLFASELMTTFQFTPPGAEPLCAQDAVSRHHYALAVLAVFAVGALIAALVWGSKPAAIAVAVAGVVALLVFLTVDLPKANNVGTLGSCSPSTTENFFEAKAVPQAGFWLEMIGALGLALSGAALATLTGEQVGALRPRWLTGRWWTERRESRKPPPKPRPVANPGPKSESSAAEKPRKERPPKRASRGGRS
jgi:hypothetical protein